MKVLDQDKHTNKNKVEAMIQKSKWVNSFWFHSKAYIMSKVNSQIKELRQEHEQYVGRLQ